MNRKHRFTQSVWSLTGALLLALPLSSAAETLMMPDRDALVGEDVVVWGVTTLGGVNYTLACGNGTDVTGPVTDGSYIPLVCNYAADGVFTTTLTVDGGTEVATAEVEVFDAAALPAFDERSVRINMAIEDGLRNLWTTQLNRAGNFPAGTTTNWGNSYPYADASLIVLAFENHGYLLTNDNVAPTGVYEKYIVRRGLNYVLSQLSALNLGVTPQGDDPCVSVSDGPAPCVGLQTPALQGYSVSLAILPFAGSGAPSRVNTEVGGVTAGMTFAEVLQRLTNTEAWGQTDGVGNMARGGEGYNLNGGQFDGSTVGWAVLAFVDAAAAGATVPAWVSTEFNFGFDNALNNDGSLDYQADGNPASNMAVGPQKNGIGLQGLFLIGEFAGARVAAVTANVDSWWSGFGGIGGNVWGGLSKPQQGLWVHDVQQLQRAVVPWHPDTAQCGPPGWPGPDSGQRLACGLRGLAGREPDRAEHYRRGDLGTIDGVLLLLLRRVSGDGDGASGSVPVRDPPAPRPQLRPPAIHGHQLYRHPAHGDRAFGGFLWT